MTLRTLALLALAVALAVTLRAEKPRITSQDQLPRLSYPFAGKVADFFTSEERYAQLAPKLRADLEKLLQDYDITDRSTLQGILNSLAAMDILEGRDDAAMARIRQMRELEEKPAVRLTLGLLAESFIETRRSGEPASGESFRASFGRTYAAKLAGLPWDAVSESIKAAKASAEVTSGPYIIGSFESQLQPGIDKLGTISGDVAQTLVAARANYVNYLPLKAERVTVLSALTAKNFKAKPDLWSARLADLNGTAGLTPTTIAIWDSGVDVNVLPDQLWTNPAEQANSRDDDGNGYIDDIHGIGYDLDSRRTADLLIPLDDALRADYPTMRNLTKGLEDLQAGVDSVEASDLKKHMSTLKADEVKDFLEKLGFFGNFTHGTHVAGIAAAGNPAIRLMPVRITFSFRRIPDTPTRERAERFARQAREVIAYLRSHGVRAVNMSWGATPRFLEFAFEANGAGGTPEERRKLAREYFDLFRTAMTEGIASAPEILFVAAAGNSNSDAQFDETVPSGIDLPNILTVGAVDQAGEETSFSSFGKNVDVHANGFEVESYLPGGERIKYSGTSMAAPNVTNLAAKLIALEPRLTVEQTIMFIKLGAERSTDGRINLIHPKRSLALLRAWQQAN